MPQDITVGYRQLCAQAENMIQTVSVEEAIDMHGRDDVTIVDIRDVRELQREGRIPGSAHCPRGMLEFWIDPGSPYHKEMFSEDRTFVFLCAGGLRSALATEVAQRMGLKPVVNMAGGFGAWRKAGGPVEDYER
jgi:rhodanese-related sulfurtransferase